VTDIIIPLRVSKSLFIGRKRFQGPKHKILAAKWKITCLDNPNHGLIVVVKSLT